MKSTIITSVLTSAITTLVLTLIIIQINPTTINVSDSNMSEDSEITSTPDNQQAQLEEAAENYNLQMQTYERIGLQINALEEYLQNEANISADQREVTLQQINNLKTERQQIASILGL